MAKLKTTRFILPLVAILLIAIPVLAAYFAPYTIIEDAGTAYDMLAVTEDVNNQFLADNDFMEADALDTRIETLSGLEKPHMVATDRTLTAVPVPANSQTNLQFTTGNTDLPSMDIITGHDGFVTIPYAAALELGNDGEIEQSGYVDTSVSGGVLFSKSGSVFSVVDSGTITSAIAGSPLIDITPVGVAGWEDVDLSAYIPSTATGVLMQVDVATKEVGVRKNGSTDNRHADFDHNWVMCGVDSGQELDIWIEDATVSIWLVAYTDSSWTWFTNAEDVSLGAGFGAWTDTDVSAICPGATGVALEIENLNAAWREKGVKVNASADNRHTDMAIGSQMHAQIGVDGAQIFDQWAEDTDVNMYVMGYCTAGATWNLNAVDKSLPGIGAYADIDCSVQAPNATHLVFEVTDAANNQDYAFKKKGAAEDIYQDTSQASAWAFPECDGAQVVEGKIQNVNVDFFLVGYITSGLYSPLVRVATASGIASGEQIIKTSITDTPDVTDYVAGASISLSMGSGIVPCVALETQELTAPAASVTFSNIDTLVAAWDSAASVTSRHLVVWINAASVDAVAKRAVEIRLNGDTGGNYNHQWVSGENAVTDADEQVNQNYLFELVGADYPFAIPGTTYANAFGGGYLLLPHAFNAIHHKAILAFNGAVEDYVSVVVGRWASTDAVTDMAITLDTGNYATGSTFILGVVDERYLVEEEYNAGANFQPDFNNIPQGGHDLAVVGFVKSTRNSGGDPIRQEINADAADASYFNQSLSGAIAVVSSATTNTRQFSEVSANIAGTGLQFSPLLVTFSQYAEGTNDPHYQMALGFMRHGAAAGVSVYSGRRNNVAAITRLQYSARNGPNFVAGSLFSLYRVPRYTIDRQELIGNAASITFASIPQDYEALQLNVYARTDVGAAAENINISLNADAVAANYDTQLLSGEAIVVAAGRSAANRVWMQCAGAGAASANEFYGGIITLNQYATTTGHKHATILRGRVENAVHLVSARWENTAAITDIVLTPAVGPNFVAGSVFELVGVMPTRALVLEVAGDVEAVDALRGASAPDIPGTDWLIDMNNTMPYMDYYEHTVASTLIVDYDPIAMVVNTGEAGTADAGSATTLDDAILDQANDYWNDARLIIVTTTDTNAPQGESTIVRDFDAANDRLTFDALTAAVDAGDTYTVDFGTLIDEQGAAQDGRITWGVNPTGVAVTLGGMVSSSQPGIGETIEDETIDILPATDTSDWYVEPDVTGSLLTNPMRPFVTIMSDTTTITEMQAWVLLGLAFVLLVTVATIRAARGHLLIAGIASSGSVLLMVVLTIFPLWALVFVILFVIGGVIAERSPVL